jgi:hypothetical protein
MHPWWGPQSLRLLAAQPSPSNRGLPLFLSICPELLSPRRNSFLRAVNKLRYLIRQLNCADFQRSLHFWVLVHPGASGKLPDLLPEVLNDKADRP